MMQWDLFKEAVRQMRFSQRLYFREPSLPELQRAKTLERAVDKMIADDDDKQTKLFNSEDVGNG